eukprot:4475042-Lingulodinium_polyedra.AAC.1
MPRAAARAFGRFRAPCRPAALRLPRLRAVRAPRCALTGPRACRRLSPRADLTPRTALLAVRRMGLLHARLAVAAPRAPARPSPVARPPEAEAGALGQSREPRRRVTRGLARSWGPCLPPLSDDHAPVGDLAFG